MLKLRRMRTFSIAQGRVRLHDASGYKVIQLQKDQLKLSPPPPSPSTAYPKKVFLMSEPVKVSPTERQGPEVLADGIQERPRRGDAQWHVGSVDFLRIMRCLHLLESAYRILQNKACTQITSSRTYPFPVLPKVSMANVSPSSIFV